MYNIYLIWVLICNQLTFKGSFYKFVGSLPFCLFAAAGHNPLK